MAATFFYSNEIIYISASFPTRQDDVNAVGIFSLKCHPISSALRNVSLLLKCCMLTLTTQEGEEKAQVIFRLAAGFCEQLITQSITQNLNRPQSINK